MKNIFGVVLLFAFAAAQAALIDNGTYISDTDSGLDWLKLAPTLNRSYNDVSSKLGAGQEFDGWHYASGNEFEQLQLNAGLLADSAYSTLGSTYTPCIAGVNFCGNEGRGFDSAAKAQMIAMSDLFGNLSVTLPAHFLFEAATIGLLSDVDTGNIDPTAHFWAEIIWAAPVGGGIYTFAGSMAPGDTDSLTASYLVRTSAIPVPAAVWLFGSALGLLGWMRRKAA